MEQVYLETTVVSYLTARPSRDLIVAAHQQITQDWWEGRDTYRLFVSELVLEEARAGDAEAAALRMRALEGIPLLEVSPLVSSLGLDLVNRNAIPRNNAIDALHIAVAAVHGVDYLLTWNMAHILNAKLRPRIERVCRKAGFEPPVLCTPAELLGESDVD